MGKLVKGKKVLCVEGKFPDGVPITTNGELFRIHQHIAVKMNARFGWRDWMEPYITRDGECKAYKIKRVTRS